jgi:Flp pilus assembly protein TadD
MLPGGVWVPDRLAEPEVTGPVGPAHPAPGPSSQGPGKGEATLAARRARTANRLVVSALVLTGISIGAYLGVGRYRVSQQARTVRTLFAARKYEQARSPLRHWLEQQPDSAEAHYYKGWLGLALDQPGEAIDAIMRAKKLGYDSGSLACLIAVYQARAGHPTEAEPALAQAFRNESEPRLEVAKALARIYLATYRLPEAGEAIKRARLLAPNDPDPYLWSNEIESRGSAETSVLIQNYRAALERNPDLDKARLGLAEQLSKARRFDDAEQEYHTYLERNPKDATALVGLGQNFFQRGDLDAATQHFEAALAIDPREPDALKELGQIDMRLGRFQTACNRFALLAEIQPYEYEIHYTYAQALKLAGDEARSRIETQLAARLRDEQDRILQLRASLLRDPKNLGVRFEVAKWMLANGHDREGLNWTAEILRAEPHHAPTHRILADYYQKQGNAGRANYHRVLASTGDDCRAAAGAQPKETATPVEPVRRAR